MPAQEYLDFVVRVDVGRDHVYPVSLTSPCGETSGSLRLPLGSADWETRLSIVAAARGQQRSRSVAAGRGGESITATDQLGCRFTDELGRDLFQSLISGDGHTCYQKSLERARDQGKGLRLRLRIQAPELAALPWEYLTDTSGNPLTLSKITPMVRHVEMPFAAQKLRLQPPIRVLGMIGCHENLDADGEKALIGRAVEHLVGNGTMSIDWVPGHTWRELQSALRHGEYHVFHFIGHGTFDEESKTGKVLFESDPGEGGGAFALNADDLARMLADHQTLRLVVLNSCEGARASQASLFSSAGSILAAQGIPGVVSMQYEISDRAALEFSRTFYDALASGTPVESAMSDARASIKTALKETIEWGTPVLHLRAPDGLLFELDFNGAILRDRPEPAIRSVPSPAPPAGSSDGRAILATKVKRFWVDGVLQKKLESDVHLKVGMDLVDSAVSNPFGAGGFLETAAGTSILDERSPGEVLAENGSLLILGDPGSGKTVALLEIARQLLANADSDAMLASPVVFNLSSWAAKRLALADWMTAELTAKYQVPRALGSNWLGSGRILPLLDGLDEVAADARAACVDAINQWIAGVLVGVVVCCRFKEYTELPSRLALNSAIRLQPLAREQVMSFVESAGAPLAGLKMLLERDSGLLLDARIPLMLTLMVRAFHGLAADAVNFSEDQGLAQRKRMVMEQFVNREFQRARQGGSLV
jgi:CHAT domain/NACHT domain